MLNLSTNRILCVDDEVNVLHMFKRTLGREFKLHTATSAEAALALLAQYPDFAAIISDYNMPEMDGLEFLKIAEKVSPDSVQILLTGNIDINISIKAINETKIFRYLPKPCAMEVLRKVVIDALQQYRLLIEKQRLTMALEQKNQELSASNAELFRKNHLLAHELEMAKTVYNNVVAYNQHSIAGLEYRLKSKEGAGGDFLLTYSNKDRLVHYVMMGDVAGHGLQSALAVLLISESFEIFCRNQPDIAQLAESINEKMCGKLPTGLFCAAFLIKLDVAQQHLDIWQGGMSDGFFLNSDGRIVKTLHSDNLPLGVLAGQNFINHISRHPMDVAESLFLFSDGVIEQTGHDASQFGETRLMQALSDAPANTQRVDFVMNAVDRHQQQTAQSDDISLLELNLTQISNTRERT
jgi:serine phosphatase RsbU (regulator of sigma subunit)